MPVLNNNQTIKLPFDIILKLDSLYQPYRYTEYNVCDDTCESDLNDHFAQISFTSNLVYRASLVGTHLYIAYSNCRTLPLTYHACFKQ